MAIPLPKYKSQVQVSGKGTAQTIDPGLTIRAAGVGDQLTAEIVEKAGGVASEYLQKKAKSKDEKTILQWEKDKLDAEQLIYQDIEGFMSEANVSYDEAYEMALKSAIPDLETKYKKLSFEYGTNQRAVDKDFSNFKSKININADKSKIELRKDSIVAMRSAQTSEFNRNYNTLTTIFRTNVKEYPDQFDELSKAYLTDINNLSSGINDSLVLQKVVTPSINSANFLVNSLQESTNLKVSLSKQQDNLEGTAEEALTTDKYEIPGQTVAISTWDADEGQWVDQQYEYGVGQSAIIYAASQQSLLDYGMITRKEYTENINKYVPVRNKIKVEGALKLNLPEAERLLKLPLEEFDLDPKVRDELDKDLKEAKKLNIQNIIDKQSDNFKLISESLINLLPSEIEDLLSQKDTLLGVKYLKYGGSESTIKAITATSTDLQMDSPFAQKQFQLAMDALYLDGNIIIKDGVEVIEVPTVDKTDRLKISDITTGFADILVRPKQGGGVEPTFDRFTTVSLLNALNSKVNSVTKGYNINLFKGREFSDLEKQALLNIVRGYKYLPINTPDQNIRRVSQLLFNWDQNLGNEEAMDKFYQQKLNPYIREVNQNMKNNQYLIY